MSFLNPLLLLGAIGISLPILAHLLNRFQVKHTDWAAMQFLNRSVRVRSRQLKLRDLLLLAMRCLAVICLVLAIARPATNAAGGSWLAGEERAGVIIAVDASYSMAHREGETTRFDRALEQVDVISEHIKPGDPVTLVMLGGEHRVLLRNVAYDRERFRKVLADQQAVPESLDLDSVPKQLKALAEDMQAQHKEVYIVTDTQAQAWGNRSEHLQAALKDLGTEAKVFMVPVIGGDENLAITHLDLVSGTLRKGSVARYQATVRNFGKTPATSVEVRCKVDGVQIDSKRIPLIPPGAAQTVSLFVPFYNAGAKQITAAITGDALDADNVRHAVAVVRDKVLVLCIDGSSGEAGKMVTDALKARAGGSDSEDYDVQTTQWPDFPTNQLNKADVVILAGVPTITKTDADRLARFVRQGKGLVWFAGDSIKPEAWNKYAGTSAKALLPATIGRAIDTSDSQGVGKPLQATLPDHTVCRPLQSLSEDLLSETRFTRCLKVEPTAASFTVLSLAGSTTPVLLERSMGRGHVFMFTTSAETTWNNMALTPAFPLLMQQVVTYLVGREFEQPRLVGDALSLSYVEQPDAGDAVFDSPSKQTITVPIQEHRGEYLALLEKSQEAGFYLAKVSVQAPGMPVAVNVDTAESDVSCIPAAQLTQSLEGTGVTVSSGDGGLSADIQAQRTGRSSWRLFMIAGLIFLVIESLLADRMHKRSATKQTAAGAPPFQAGVA